MQHDLLCYSFLLSFRLITSYCSYLSFPFVFVFVFVSFSFSFRFVLFSFRCIGLRIQTLSRFKPQQSSEPRCTIPPPCRHPAVLRTTVLTTVPAVLLQTRCRKKSRKRCSLQTCSCTRHAPSNIRLLGQLVRTHCWVVLLHGPHPQYGRDYTHPSVCPHGS